MLSSIWKGIALATCNVFLVALLIAIGDSDEFRTTRDKVLALYALVIVGLPPALVVGAFAGWISGRLPVFRRLALIGLTASAILTLGLLTFPKWIPFAIIPTVGGALALELWSRSNLAAYVPRTIPPSPVWIGILLGAATVCAVAVVLGFYVKADPMRVRLGLGGELVAFQVTALVTCIGMLPGIAVGAFAGFLAGRLEERSPSTRIAALGGVAVFAVLILAELAEQTQLVVPAIVPCVAMALALERITRRAPALPIARALA